MDFDPVRHFEAKGHGVYERLTASQLHAALPLLWLAYSGEPSDSGAIHSDVKQRWRNGDADAVQGMNSIASVAAKACEAIRLGDSSECRRLMAENFRLRRKLFGDAVLGSTNLKLINIAEQNGAVAKFPGSGGAVVGTCDAEKLAAARARVRAGGAFVFVELEPHLSDDGDGVWRRGWARWRWCSSSVRRRGHVCCKPQTAQNPQSTLGVRHRRRAAQHFTGFGRNNPHCVSSADR